jgi:MFS family permease
MRLRLGARRGGARLQTFRSFRNRDYRLLWAGSAFSNMAQMLQLITLGWLVWELTKDPETGQGSALLSGTAAGLRAVPTLIIGPWAGVLADRVDRRMLVMVPHIFLAVLAVFFALLVASGNVQVWHVFVYASISAVANAVFHPASTSLVANTVPPEDLSNAIALRTMNITANRLIGSMLGGLLISTVGIKSGLNFFVEAGAYVGMVLLLIPMKTPYQVMSTAQHSSVVSNLGQGIRYIWKDNRIILHLMVSTLVLSLLFQPLPVLLPAYTSQVLHSEADVGGFLLAAMGVGGFTATFIIASFGFGFKKGTVSLVSLVMGCMAVLILAQSHWVILSLAMMAVMGLFRTFFMVSNNTLVQTLTHDTLRGRVSSLYHLENGITPAAIFLISLFMELFTVSGALTVGASAGLGLSLYFLLAFRQVRQLE